MTHGIKKVYFSVIALFIVSSMTFSLIGCGAGAPETGTPSAPVTTQTVTLKGTVSALESDVASAGLSSVGGVTTHGKVRLMTTTTITKGTAKVYSVDKNGVYTYIEGSESPITADGYECEIGATAGNYIVRCTTDSADGTQQIVLDAYQSVDADDVLQAAAGPVEKDTPVTPTTSGLAVMIVERVIKELSSNDVTLDDSIKAILISSITAVFEELVEKGAISLSGLQAKPAAQTTEYVTNSNYVAAADEAADDKTIQLTLDEEVAQKVDNSKLTIEKAKDNLYKVVGIMEPALLTKMRSEGDYIGDLLARYMVEGANTTLGSAIANLRDSQPTYDMGPGMQSTGSSVTFPTDAAIYADLNTILTAAKADKTAQRAFAIAAASIPKNAAGQGAIEFWTTIDADTSVTPSFILYVLLRQIQIVSETYGLEDAMQLTDPMLFVQNYITLSAGIIYSDIHSETIFKDNAEVTTLRAHAGIVEGDKTISSVVVQNAAGTTIATLSEMQFGPSGQTQKEYMYDPWQAQTSPPITSGTFNIVVTYSDASTERAEHKVVVLDIDTPTVSIVEDGKTYTINQSTITHTKDDYLTIRWTDVSPTGYETLYFLQIERLDPTTFMPTGMVYDGFRQASTALENKVLLEDGLYEIRVMGDVFELPATLASARTRRDTNGSPQGFLTPTGGIVKVTAGDTAPATRTEEKGSDIYKQEFDQVAIDLRKKMEKLGVSNIDQNQHFDDAIFYAAEKEGWSPEEMRSKRPEDILNIYNTLQMAGDVDALDENTFVEAEKKRQNMVQNWDKFGLGEQPVGIIGTEHLQTVNEVERFYEGANQADIDWENFDPSGVFDEKVEFEKFYMSANQETVDYSVIDASTIRAQEQERADFELFYKTTNNTDTVDWSSLNTDTIANEFQNLEMFKGINGEDVFDNTEQLRYQIEGFNEAVEDLTAKLDRQDRDIINQQLETYHVGPITFEEENMITSGLATAEDIQRGLMRRLTQAEISQIVNEIVAGRGFSQDDLTDRASAQLYRFTGNIAVTNLPAMGVPDIKVAVSMSNQGLVGFRFPQALLAMYNNQNRSFSFDLQIPAGQDSYLVAFQDSNHDGIINAGEKYSVSDPVPVFQNVSGLSLALTL